MEELIYLLKRCPLFYGIRDDELYTLLKCCGAREERYEPEELVFRMGEAMNTILVLVEGEAWVFQENFWGQREELFSLKGGEVFGHSYSCARTPALPVHVATKTACRAVFLDYQRMITFCSLACDFHTRLIQNLLRLLAESAVDSENRQRHMSRKTTREKLLSYLSGQALFWGSRTFEIPHSRKELADYLGVDRSAMSSELGKLKAEGVLDYKRNRFELKGSPHPAE